MENDIVDAFINWLREWANSPAPFLWGYTIKKGYLVFLVPFTLMATVKILSWFRP